MTRRIDGSLVVPLCALAAVLAVPPGLLTGRLATVVAGSVAVVAALGLAAEAVLGPAATVGHTALAGAVAGLVVLPAAVGAYYVLVPAGLDQWWGSSLVALLALGPLALPAGFLAGWLAWHRRHTAATAPADLGHHQPA